MQIYTSPAVSVVDAREMPATFVRKRSTTRLPRRKLDSDILSFGR